MSFLSLHVSPHSKRKQLHQKSVRIMRLGGGGVSGVLPSPHHRQLPPKPIQTLVPAPTTPHPHPDSNISLLVLIYPVVSSQHKAPLASPSPQCSLPEEVPTACSVCPTRSAWDPRARCSPVPPCLPVNEAQKGPALEKWSSSVISTGFLLREHLVSRLSLPGHTTFLW